MKQVEVAVIGGGLAGTIAALALARGGRRVVLVAAPPTKADQRTTTLMDQSIRFIERLTLWERIAPTAAALKTMQIIDGTKRLLRAPTVAFRASEIGLDAFGYNIPNTALLGVLDEAARAEGNITVIEANACRCPHSRSRSTPRSRRRLRMTRAGRSCRSDTERRREAAHR